MCFFSRPRPTRQSLTAPPRPTGGGSLFDTREGQTTAPSEGTAVPPPVTGDIVQPVVPSGAEPSTSLRWHGEVPAQKWMNFYTKVLSRLATGKGLRLIVSVDVSPEGGVSSQAVQETKTALRELGLNDELRG